MTPPIHALRVKLTAATIVVASMAAGHAAARNHDTQAFRPSAAAPMLHDRAPGPALRVPN